MVAVIVLAALALLLFVFVAAGVRIVRPFQRGIVERLGRYKETVDPGLRIIIPLIEHLRLVDMREQVVDVPPQEVITKDNVVVSVDAVVYYEPTDAQRLVYNVANFMLAVTKLAQTNLRNLVGDLQLDEALTSRDQINIHLRQILDDATDSWGVRVKRVELQRIDPPPDVMHSMHEQMKAERTRRAVVLTASGEREAADRHARGSEGVGDPRGRGCTQRQILEAEGQAGAIKAVAEAERYRQITVAEGQAQATESVFRGIHAGNPDAGSPRDQVPRGAAGDRERPRDEDLPSGRHEQHDGLTRRRRRAVPQRRRPPTSTAMATATTTSRCSRHRHRRPTLSSSRRSAGAARRRGSPVTSPPACRSARREAPPRPRRSTGSS